MPRNKAILSETGARPMTRGDSREAAAGVVAGDPGDVENAADVAAQYGHIDGAHHKQWVIDQMLRAALGPKRYREWREARDEDGDDWDVGRAP